MFIPWFALGIMDKFFIMNIHDATPKNPKNNFVIFFPFFSSWCMKKIIHVLKNH
jgi:hypothetical protein